MKSRTIVFAVALACAACGSGGLYPVKGSVTHKGQPAAGATVTFLKKSQTSGTREAVAQGVVGEDGTFELFGPAGKGAPPGEYVVLVEWKEGAGRARGRAPALNAPDRLKKRYLDADRPLLTASIEAKTNKLPPFEVE
jgi:hypothetical protein